MTVYIQIEILLLDICCQDSLVVRLDTLQFLGWTHRFIFHTKPGEQSQPASHFELTQLLFCWLLFMLLQDLGHGLTQDVNMAPFGQAAFVTASSIKVELFVSQDERDFQTGGSFMPLIWHWITYESSALQWQLLFLPRHEHTSFMHDLKYGAKLTRRWQVEKVVDFSMLHRLIASTFSCQPHSSILFSSPPGVDLTLVRDTDFLSEEQMPDFFPTFIKRDKVY